MKKSGNLFRNSACQTAEVRFVRFCTFSKAELQSWSVAQITQSKLYEGNRPMTGGPNDLRLGVNSMEFACETCGEKRECPGHFGHIKLFQPVFHYGFMEYIEKILKCICHRCSKLKLFTTEQQSEKFKRIISLSNPSKKLREMAKLLGPINQCPLEQQNRKGCGSVIPTKISVKQHKIVIQQKHDKKVKQYNYTAQKIYTIFSKINKDDSALLGFTRTQPVDLLISTLAVAPPQVRPSIQMNPQKKAQDDITITYCKIVNLNNDVKNCHQTAQRAIKVLDIERLIASIMVAVDRITINSIQSGNSRKRKKAHKIKSIEQRLKAKQGRFRQHLMGKRVDFSARSVISPDSNLALDQLGVPEKIAKSLTIPQQVTQWNFERIIQLCKKGSVKFILRPSVDNKRYQDFIYVNKIANSSEEIQKYLSYGTIVERNLEDGDYVLFNRQPTLHRMSMMAHRVKILPYNTFRLNLSVCTPYNADFDGDQMNMHVPQSLQAIAQLKHIAHVSKQVIAPKNNAPIMGIVQDSLLGIYLLTMRDTFLTKEEIMNLLVWIQPCIKLEFGELPMPAIIKPVPMWTGKQVVSLLIPTQISVTIMKGKDGLKNVQDTSMFIRNGQLISGALQKQVVGSGAGGLVHAIWLQLGSQATSQFITNAQRVANNWLMTSTFSVGTEDVIIDKQLEERTEAEIKNIKSKYYSILNKYRSAKYVEDQNLHQRGYNIGDSFQAKINMELNNALSNIQKIIVEKVSSYKNNIYKMIVAKSKGSQTNLAQIMLCLGNQNVDGQRCPLGFLRRALPHFCKDDNSPQPRGFVFSSFCKGLKPHEFFFHSMGGRQGLSDTAVKTSNIGYIQRKLVKSLQDLSIRYDGTVRDSQNNLLQKFYGEDGFLSEFIEKQRSYDTQLSEEAFANRMRWDRNRLEQFGYGNRQIKKIYEQFQELKRCRQTLRQIFINSKETIQVEYFCPIKMQRLFKQVLSKTRVQNIQEEQLQYYALKPLEVIQMVETLIQDCVIPQTRKHYLQLCSKLDKHKNRRTFKQFQQQSGLEIFHIHLRLSLASKVLNNVYKFSKEELQILFQEIKSKYKQSIAPSGQAIGSVAAQSIGQPTTQMTLNTFHLAGVSDRNVTLGIPRLRELLDTSKKIKTPMMTIFYHSRIPHTDKQDQETTRLLAELISFDFPQRHIKDYLLKTRIYYDPNPQNSNIGAPFSNDNPHGAKSPWVLSLTFDKKKLTPRILEQIYKKLDKTFEKQFDIIEKEGMIRNNPQIIMRCLDTLGQTLSKSKYSDQNTLFKYLTTCQISIKQIFISGIKGLKTVKTAKKLICNPPLKDDLSKISKEEHEEIIFETTGTNLRECLSHYKIDYRRTYCNDINQIYDTLGIEAARQSFINQFKQILKPYNIYINHRHLSVLADWISVRGSLTPINRNGINRVRDVSVLRKASFEETADVLFGAAVFSQVDELRGVSERIIFGETVKLGTNSFEVILDREKVKNPYYRFQKDKIPIQEPINDGSKTPAALNSPTQENTIQFKTSLHSLYNAGNTPNFMTPLYTHEQSNRIGSPRYLTSPNYQSSVPFIGTSTMQSPIYQSPTLRLGDTFADVPARLNPFEQTRKNNVKLPQGNNITSSPKYSPIIYGGNPKKEEEEEGESSQSHSE